MAVGIFTAAWVNLYGVWAARAMDNPAWPPVSAWYLAALLVAGSVATNWVIERMAGATLARLAIIALGLAATAAVAWLTYRFDGAGAFLQSLTNWGSAVSPVLVGVAACLFVWWRGVLLASAPQPQDYLEHSFLMGAIAFGLLFALNRGSGLLAAGEALGAVAIFFATGLGALALVSFENARQFHQGATGTWLALNQYWLVTVLTVIGLILLAGFAAGTMLSPESLNGLAHGLRRLFDGLVFWTGLLLGLMVFVVAWVIVPLGQLLTGRLRGQPLKPPPEVPTPAELAGQSVAAVGQHPWLVVVGQVLLVLCLAGLAAGLFWLAARRVGQQGRRDDDEQRDSIATRELVWAQLRAVFRRTPQSAPLAAPYLDLAGAGDDPRLVIRRAYQTMLEWARALSLPRAAGQTPAAYARALTQALPRGQGAIEALTGAYERARYAAEPPSADEARTALGALAALQAMPPSDGSARRKR